jgi:cytochrome c oxidase subunit II
MLSLFSILAQANPLIVEESDKFLKGVTSETPEGGGGTFWMPFRASTYAGEVDWTFYFIYWICVVFTIGIFVAMTWFVIKYRHKANQHAPAHKAGHSTTLELTWTVVPTILVLLIFYFGFRSYLAMAVVPPDAYEINVTAQMWSWSFTYPDGHVNPELHVPAGVPVRLVLTSQDVIHSLYVPAFRAKKDAVPGRYNKMWFQSDVPGRYQIMCTEYCGTHHSNMGAVLVVHPLKEPAGNIETWAEWEATSRNPRNQPNPTLLGQTLYTDRGCNQCHSIDGTSGRGPTWLNLFGSQRQFRDGGSAVADENYIVESINQPQAHVVVPYDGIMPSYQGQFHPDELTAIIAYLKSISEQYKSQAPTTWEQADGNAAPGASDGSTAPQTEASPDTPGATQQPVAPATPTTPQGENIDPRAQPPLGGTAQPAPGGEQKQDPIESPKPDNQ